MWNVQILGAYASQALAPGRASGFAVCRFGQDFGWRRRASRFSHQTKAATSRVGTSHALNLFVKIPQQNKQCRSKPPSCAVHSSSSHFMTQYLISNCGFTPSDAAKHSECLSHLNSSDKPDSVLLFLRRLGLDASSVRRVISFRPSILRASVTKTLEPKLVSIRAAGFSDTDIADIFVACPHFLLVNILPKLQLLGAYLPSKVDLLRALRQDFALISGNLTHTLVPNVALLRAHGAAERDIARALIAMPRLLTKELFDRVVGLGFPCGTKTFLYALYVLGQLSKKTFRGKVDMMKSFGWSEAEFYAAFRKAPTMISLSAETLRTKMRFLMEEARLELGYIAERPVLLTYNLEKRLVPRHRVLQILKAEGLPGSKVSLSSVVPISEEKFLRMYVLPHLDRVPAIREIYPDAGAGKV